MLVVMAVFG